MVIDYSIQASSSKEYRYHDIEWMTCKKKNPNKTNNNKTRLSLRREASVIGY